jgi:hypothetical protein
MTKIIAHILAVASLAALSIGCACAVLIGPTPALLGFAGFAGFGALAVFINPEL